MKVSYMVTLDVRSSWNEHLSELDWRLKAILEERCKVPIELKRQYVLTSEEEHAQALARQNDDQKNP